MSTAQRQLDLLLSSIAIIETDALPKLADSKLLKCCDNASVSAAAYFAALRSAVNSSLQAPVTSQAAAATAADVLEAGVACLLRFMQLNLCGPVRAQHTPLWQSKAAAASTAAGAPQDGPPGTWGRQGAHDHKQLGQDNLSDDDRWVVAQLEVDGEDVVGRVRGLDLLLAALICIAEPLGHTTTTDAQQQHHQQQQQQVKQPGATAAAAAVNGTAAQQQQQQLQGLLLDAAQLQQLHLGSWSWWCMRAVMLQQHVLSSRSLTLRNALKQLTLDTLAWSHTLHSTAAAAGGVAAAAAAAAAGSAAGGAVCTAGANGTAAQQQYASTAAAAEAHVLSAVAHLEVAMVQQSLGRVSEAQQQLEAAAAALGVTVELRGALGVRTQHQIDPKAQLIAAVKPAAAGSSGSNGSAAAAVAAAVGALAGLEGLDVAALGFEDVGLTKELEGMDDDSSVYLAPRLVEQPGTAAAATAAISADSAAAAADVTEKQGDAATAGQQPPPPPQQQQRLSPLLQALLLGWAAQVKKGTSQDELQQWQMAPFVEAVLQQQLTQYMLHATARLLKCRHEKARGRTRERALMQLEQLCNSLEATQPLDAARLPLVFAVRFPLWPLLRKELAEFYIAMGFVGAALKIFESLDMWDQLIVCYRLLDKKQAAQELVLARLQVAPADAKLWCALGDVTHQEQHYLKAWEVSGHRSSRAQRSLGRAALRNKDFTRAAAAYEAALALNPLYPDVWFSLGYCYLKLDQPRKALQAFSKVTQEEPEQGEAWANLCALWLQEGGWREALHAGEQAIKFKRDSWQAWDNYALAAAKAGAAGACVRGLAKVLELTKGQRFPLQTAEELLGHLESQQQQLSTANGPTSTSAAATANTPAAAGSAAAGSTAATAAAAAAAAADDGEEVMEPPEQLLQMLHLTQSLPGSSNGTDDAAGSSDQQAATAAATAAAQQRSQQQVLQQLGGVLKGVTNSPACGAAVWGLLARWYDLQGEWVSCQEARLKQVRALQASPFRSDPEAFAAIAAASAQLVRAYLATAAGGQGGVRELAAGRMHLRGLLKQCEAAFEAREEYTQLQQLLEQVAAAEEETVVAQKQQQAAGA